MEQGSSSPWLSLLGRPAVLAPAGLLMLLLLAGMSVWLAGPHAADQPYWGEGLRPPAISGGHWFGTDAIGRDMLARTAVGLLVSLAIGFGAGLLALVLGMLLGGLAGYVGGLLDEAIMRVIDLATSLPLLLVAILLLALFEPSMWLLMLLVGAFGSLEAARLLRIEARRLRNAEFLLAARLQGASELAVLRRHLLPNLLPCALTALGMVVPQAILVESFLAFLGLSPGEEAGSLGTLLAEGVQDLQWAPWTLVFPALALALVLVAFGLLGDALRRGLREQTGSAL